MLKKIKIDFIILFLILSSALLIRVFFLESLPPNITGDEVTNLEDVLTIIFEPSNKLLNLMGDGSVAGINFYYSSFFIIPFGISDAILAVRFSVAVLSIVALVPFYFFLKERTSRFIACCFTLLFSGNYVFLNFSRTAWVNMGVVVSGLFLVWCLEKAFVTRKTYWYALAGVFAGLSLYGYHYGKVLVVFVCIYLISTFFNRSLWIKKYFFQIILFFAVTISIFSPLFFSTIFRNDQKMFERPKTTFVFNGQYATPLTELIKHQIFYTVRGLILLDGSVMSEGIENRRYVPLYTPPVNIVVKTLFFLGLIIALMYYKKKLNTWWLIACSSFFVVAITESPPNYSRGLFFIPFIYFVSAVGVFHIFEKLKKNTINLAMVICYILFAFASSVLFAFDVLYYFNWMQNKTLADSRQPAIEYWEYKKWQEYQIDLIKQGKKPLNNYEWYKINPRINLTAPTK